MSEEISKILDLAPLEDFEDDNPIQEGEIILESGDQVQDDFDFARNNIYELIEKSAQAMKEMMELAKASQHPRSFEVLNNMFKNMADFNKDLIDLQKKKKEIIQTPSINNESPQNVTNNLFVGTTADFTKMLEDARNKNINE